MAAFDEALEKAMTHRGSLHTSDVTALLEAGPEDRRLLYRLADQVRSRYVGDEIHLRGIIEFSNHCSRHCLYCGLRSDNRAVARYRMKPQEILEASRKAAAMGLKTIVLQSGEDQYYTTKKLAYIISSIKNDLDVAVTLSVGIRSPEDLHTFKKAGADRYLLKHETSDPGLFEELRPGTSLESRVRCLRLLKHMGYQVGSGNMVGLPGQTIATLAGDILLLRDLDVEMAGIGPFMPHPQTPLEGHSAGDLDTTLAVLAVVRLVVPGAHLPATTAIETLHSDGRRLALQCGANVIMPNVTPTRYRPHYSIYPNKYGIDREPQTAVEEILSLADSMGRPIGKDYGHGPPKKYIPEDRLPPGARWR